MAWYEIDCLIKSLKKMRNENCFGILLIGNCSHHVKEVKDKLNVTNWTKPSVLCWLV